MPISLPPCSRGGPAGREGGHDGGQGHGGRGNPLPSCKPPKAPPPLPTIYHCDKQVDLLLSRGRGAMIKACCPLLVFSRVSLTMMGPSLLSSLSALAAKMGAGGKKQPLLPMPPLPPTGGEGHSGNRRFCHCHPDCNVYVNRATCDGLTNVQG
jgi:hypothetical protein